LVGKIFGTFLACSSLCTANPFRIDVIKAPEKNAMVRILSEMEKCTSNIYNVINVLMTDILRCCEWDMLDFSQYYIFQLKPLKKNVLEIRIFHIIMSLMMETKYVCAMIDKKI
jgi:hypothetical protein